MTVTEPIQIHEYENGLALVTQRMDWVESAAFSLLSCPYVAEK